MRIAISGAHRTGKTTLAGVLGRELTGYVSVDEPYDSLAEEGYAFAAFPSVADFEAQLERSLASVLHCDPDCIFDRCPADLLAYLITHRDAGQFDLEAWLQRVHGAMTQVDLVVFVPVEHPDRIPVSEDDFGDLRDQINAELRDILLDDRWGFGVPAIEVTGTVDARAHQVLAHIRR